MMVAVVAMGGSLVIAMLAGLFLVMKKKRKANSPGSSPGSPPAASTPSAESLTTFTPGQKVSISKDGKVLGHKLNLTNSDNVCDIAYPATSGVFLLDKAGSGYSMTVNCNGDGKWLSFLADDAGDMIQPVRNLKDKKTKPAWLVSCPSASQGCTIQAAKSKKYVAPEDTSFGVGLSSDPTYWTFANA